MDSTGGTATDRHLTSRNDHGYSGSAEPLDDTISVDTRCSADICLGETAPITWSGNSFTAQLQASETSESGIVVRVTIQVSGTVSADGQSVSNLDFYDELRQDSTLIGTNTDYTHLVTNESPIPISETYGLSVYYEITGAQVESYLHSVEQTLYLESTNYGGTDFDSNDPQPRLWVGFTQE